MYDRATVRHCSSRHPRRVSTVLLVMAIVGAAWPSVSPRATPRLSVVKPALGRTAVIAPVAGKVLVRQKGMHDFTLLRQPRTVTLGATVDTMRGTAQITTAGLEHGKLHYGLFNGGAFRVTQQSSGLTDLTLSGGPPTSRCGSPFSSAIPKARRSVSPRVLRLLHARVSGPFRTIGKYTAATVRGTEWLTEDTCNGTLTNVQRGTVLATHLGSSQLITLTRQSLFPTSLALYCASAGSPSFGSTCLSAQTRTGPGLVDLEIDTSVLQGPYDLCITAPHDSERCSGFALGAAGSDGRSYSTVGCYSAGEGLYRARWISGGRQLGVPVLFSMPRPPMAMPLGGGACVNEATMLIPGTNTFSASTLSCPPFRYSRPVARLLVAPPPGCPS